MEQYSRITDEKVRNVIEEVKSGNNENVGKESTSAILEMLLDIRQFLRKIYQNMPKKPRVYKQPTGKKEDIIVGEK